MALRKYLFIFLVLIGFSLTLVVFVKAQDAYEPPSDCPDDFTIDVNCQLKRIENPKENCNVTICKGKDPDDLQDKPATYEKLLEFFGDRAIYINSDKKAAGLINLGITSFLGIVTVFAALYGVYVGGVKRAKTTNQDEITTYNKTLVNIIIGFILAWSFIFIMQFVSNLLGLGSLNELVVFENEDEVGDNGSIITVN